MREFKFRVWQGNSIDYFGFTDVCMGLLDPTGYGVWDAKIMQYTGLKDRNGKEIYEGDILKSIMRINEDWRPTLQVSFLNGCFMFGNWNAHEYFNKHTEIEVTGNIYENKDLLEN